MYQSEQIDKATLVLFFTFVIGILTVQDYWPRQDARGVPSVHSGLCQSLALAPAEENSGKSCREPVSRQLLASCAVPVKPGPECDNAELAAAAIDGMVLQPNQEFSFNAAVGRRTAARGYLPGLMYNNGQALVGTGGGVCMLSTALYDAALHAGLKILGRSAHSGPVGYAEPGLDAAVAYGALDLRLKNDTGHPIQIRAGCAADSLVVKILGAKPPGQSISVETAYYREIPPGILEIPADVVDLPAYTWLASPRPGCESATIRKIFVNGKLVRRELISRDRYPARDGIVTTPNELNEQLENLAENSAAETPDATVASDDPASTGSVETPAPTDRNIPQQESPAPTNLTIGSPTCHT